MKLYTPTEIAQFVLASDLREATERQIIEALKQWDGRAKDDCVAIRQEATVVE